MYYDGADDRLKNKIAGEYDAISIEVLKEIIEESMRVFWEFLRADKHEDTFVLKQYHGTKLDHQDAAAHLELLMDIKSKLQKVCFTFIVLIPLFMQVLKVCLFFLLYFFYWIS